MKKGMKKSLAELAKSRVLSQKEMKTLKGGDDFIIIGDVIAL